MQNTTSSHVGIYPTTIYVPAHRHTSAINHYRSALKASAVTRGNLVQLQSRFSFRFHIKAVRQVTPSSVRLVLPINANRESVARALGGTGAPVLRGRQGIVVTDKFNITWTLI